ncbi:hypothetical protein [Anthocerotibacter panamensis]|uniref:hypothetical protein n=1 Tax=Anthocerotibacter panamensis TaxID=2857077 RepID=UPI001C407EF4|nr:hypothetical protein [Anthocerotibacter panamensis]
MKALFRLVVLTLIMTLTALGAPCISAAPEITPAQWQVYQDMAVDLLQKYLRINTSNPPGNEIETAKFLKQIFEREGIPSEIFTYEPEKGSGGHLMTAPSLVAGGGSPALAPAALTAGLARIKQAFNLGLCDLKGR